MNFLQKIASYHQTVKKIRDVYLMQIIQSSYSKMNFFAVTIRMLLTIFFVGISAYVCAAPLPTPPKTDTESWTRWKDMYVRVETDGNLSCYSENSSECYYGPTTVIPINAKKLICGEHHRSLYGNTGYDQVRHWCNNSYADIFSKWSSKASSGVNTLISRNAAGQIMCFSQDGENCSWGMTSRPANTPIAPLVCGEVHKEVYGSTGYDQEGHWCAMLRRTTIAITSDPQYPWANQDDITSSGNDEADSKISIPLTYNSINKYHKEKSPIDAVFINGDVTAYGHGWQWDYMLKTAIPMLTPPVYMGLGNHDYEDNVDDCAQNGCVRNSLNALLKYIPSGSSIDGNVRYYYEFPDSIKEYKGSFSWSRDLGGIHFVFLNNEPTYSFSASGFNGADSRKEKFIITSAIPWLEKDLSAARKEGKPIVLVYHKPAQFKETDGITRGVFEGIVKKYKVSLVLWGHVHTSGGKLSYFGGAPAIFSGSASTQTYLIADFNAAAGNVKVSLSKSGDIDNMQDIGEFPLLSPSENLPVTPYGCNIKFVNGGGIMQNFLFGILTRKAFLQQKAALILRLGVHGLLIFRHMRLMFNHQP